MKHLSVPEVARTLDVTEETIRRWCRAGSLSHYKIGNTIRVTPQDLESYIGSLYKPAK